MFSPLFLLFGMIFVPLISLILIISAIYFLFKGITSHMKRDEFGVEEIKEVAIIGNTPITINSHPAIVQNINSGSEGLSPPLNLKIGRYIGLVIIFLIVLMTIITLIKSKEDLAGKIIEVLPICILPYIFSIFQLLFPYYAERAPRKAKVFMMLDLYGIMTIFTVWVSAALFGLYSGEEEGITIYIGMTILILRVILTFLNLIYIYDTRRKSSL